MTQSQNFIHWSRRQDAEEALRESIIESGALDEYMDDLQAHLKVGSTMIRELATTVEAAEVTRTILESEGIPFPVLSDGRVRCAVVARCLAMTALDMGGGGNDVALLRTAIERADVEIAEAVRLLPRPAMVARAQQRHIDYVAGCVADGVKRLSESPNFDDLVDGYFAATHMVYLQAGEAPEAMSGGEVIRQLSVRHTDLLQSFPMLKRCMPKVSPLIEGLVYRAVISRALADMVAAGPLAERAGPIAEAHAQKALNDLASETRGLAGEVPTQGRSLAD